MKMNLEWTHQQQFTLIEKQYRVQTGQVLLPFTKQAV
jgi:hypothetical protein